MKRKKISTKPEPPKLEEQEEYKLFFTSKDGNILCYTKNIDVTNRNLQRYALAILSGEHINDIKFSDEM